MSGGSPLIVRMASGLARVDAAGWDACAGADNPFVSYAFLRALEESRSVGPGTGWQPCHLIVETAGRIVAVAPTYLKGHSFGEYVFDHAWADAYERAGVPYYPKVQVAVPFTPVTGPRLMVHPDQEAAALEALVEGLQTLADRHGLSSIHVTFPTAAEWHRLGALGWLKRLGQQYHWDNRGYGSFEDFLADLHAGKRKTIRRERRAVAESGVRIHALTGADLKPAHWDAFYRCYRHTSDGKWGFPYLTRDFFHRLGADLGGRVVLFLAERDGDWIAGALNLLGNNTLYGRNWGALQDQPFLHFEMCYYRALAFAIEHRLTRVEAGAQGEHKVLRGYVPRPTYSAHWIRDHRFRNALAQVLAAEAEAVSESMAALEAATPFRKCTETCGG